MLTYFYLAVFNVSTKSRQRLTRPGLASEIIVKICFIVILMILMSSVLVKSPTYFYLSTSPVPKKKTIYTQNDYGRFVYSQYNFHQVNKVFFNSSFFYPQHLSKEEYEKMLVKNIPVKLRKKFMKILPVTLDLAELHQIDPLWVLAVMWTEAHYDHRAISRKGAKGLMQITPATKKYLIPMVVKAKKSLKFKPVAHRNSLAENIEMGIIYLKYLLKRFDNNGIYATVAYNMGPTWTQKQLNNNYPVGVKNQYVKKVLQAYSGLNL